MRADKDTLRSRYGVVMARTQQELLGVTCTELQEIEPDRKQIVVSRSFGREVIELDDLSEALSTFAVRAGEKLRARALQANGVWVWLNTNPFKPEMPQYHPSRAMKLIAVTSDTREILLMAQALMRSMYRKGYCYKKAGVGLLDLTPGDIHQGDLFSGVDPRSAKLMSVLDTANQKFGRGTMGFASSGWREKPKWGMRQENLSPAYTSRWDQLLRVT
jgi:DNA polymerase V